MFMMNARRLVVTLCTVAFCHHEKVHALRPYVSSTIRSSSISTTSWCGTGFCRRQQPRQRLNEQQQQQQQRSRRMSMVNINSEEEANKAKMRLRAEAEAPLRKVRIFAFSGFIASAAVGLLVAGSRLLALSQNIDQGQTFQELTTNVAVDLSAIAIFSYFVKQDLAAQSGRLARMEIGAKLAGLKVRLQLPDDADTVTLSALRRDRGRDKRVAVLVGGKAAVENSLESAIPFSAALETSDIIIVPLVLEAAASGADVFRASGGESDLDSAVGRPHVALPVVLNRWQEYIDTEVATAVSQGIDPLEDGFSLVLKKNGRIGARSKGCPPWGTLVGDVEKRKEAGMDVSNI